MSKRPNAVIATTEDLAAFEAGVDEAKRREHGDFDGLLGHLPTGASHLLRDIVSHLRDCLLRNYTDDDARRMLAAREPRVGFHRMPVVTDDVALAIDLLNTIRSATRCEGDRFVALVLGPEVLKLRPAAARDEKRQAGVCKAGKTRGEQRAVEAAAEHEQWRKDATALVAQGKELRNVAAILAERHNKSPSTIRRALRKARTS